MGTIGKRFSIYIDLDGPILDVSQRYYVVHSLIMKKLKIKDNSSKDKYWRLKRARHNLIIYNKSLSQELKREYRALWLRFIEQKKYLSYDKIRLYAKKTLNKLSKNNALNLITVRQNKRNLLWELKRFDLLKYFAKILISSSIKAINAKAKLIMSNKRFSQKDSMIIGDTEVDIISGKKCKIKTVAVLCGIRNQKLLKALNPDIIVKDIITIPKLIQKGKI